MPGQLSANSLSFTSRDRSRARRKPEVGSVSPNEVSPSHEDQTTEQTGTAYSLETIQDASRRVHLGQDTNDKCVSAMMNSQPFSRNAPTQRRPCSCGCSKATSFLRLGGGITCKRTIVVRGSKELCPFPKHSMGLPYMPPH